MFVVVQFGTGRFLGDDFMRMAGRLELTGEQSLCLEAGRDFHLRVFVLDALL